MVMILGLPYRLELVLLSPEPLANGLSLPLHALMLLALHALLLPHGWLKNRSTLPPRVAILV